MVQYIKRRIILRNYITARRRRHSSLLQDTREDEELRRRVLSAVECGLTTCFPFSQFSLQISFVELKFVFCGFPPPSDLIKNNLPAFEFLKYSRQQQNVAGLPAFFFLRLILQLVLPRFFAVLKVVFFGFPAPSDLRKKLINLRLNFINTVVSSGNVAGRPVVSSLFRHYLRSDFFTPFFSLRSLILRVLSFSSTCLLFF